VIASSIKSRSSSEITHGALERGREILFRRRASFLHVSTIVDREISGCLAWILEYDQGIERSSQMQACICGLNSGPRQLILQY